jgi:hypothetical protein
MQVSKKFIHAIKLDPRPQYKLAWEAGINPSTLSQIVTGYVRLRIADPRVIFVCEDLNNIVNSMNLIIECFNREGDAENCSPYNAWVLQSMVESLKDTLKNAADELYTNLGIARIMKLDNP